METVVGLVWLFEPYAIIIMDFDCIFGVVEHDNWWYLLQLDKWYLT